MYVGMYVRDLMYKQTDNQSRALLDELTAHHPITVGKISNC